MVVKAKPKNKLTIPQKRVRPSKVAVGFDLSPASLAGCAKMRDGTLNKMRDPVWTMTRWDKDITHFEKLRQLAKADEFVHTILNDLGGIIRDLDDIHIGVEDLPPRPMNANRYREQAELIGSFLGGLLRYRFPHVYLVNSKSWQALVAADLGMKVNKDFDKWKIKNWARETFDAPRWPDLIRNNKSGLIPKPKGSVAMPEQPDDRYDSTGIMEWVWEEASK